MGVVIAKRVLGSIGAIFGATILAFIVMRALPGNPARLIVGPLATPQAVASVSHQIGLDKPIFTQYWLYISHFFEGDWGYSYADGKSVSALIGERLGATIELALFSFGITMIFAVLCALLVTYRRRPIADRILRGVAYLGFGTPPFFVALILLIVFFRSFHILPGPEGRLGLLEAPPPTVTHMYTLDALIAGQFGTFWSAFEHLILPGVALGLSSFSFIVRLLRANLLEISREPFITVARGKGLRRWTAFRRHALPNAFLPTLTAGGLVLGEFLAGSVLIERVFNWPGIGSLVFDAIVKQDYAVVQTFILLSAVMFVLVNLIVDLLYAVIDPRVRIPSAATA
ncbi:MAG TPA: ABC transporter permease [Solirubrobacteraceae bacterium]|jgi:peptide/nickel transport system permease protein|nr:ABC transporter permease [Solirubrobacteraceae bacterium]